MKSRIDLYNENKKIEKENSKLKRENKRFKKMVDFLLDESTNKK